MACVSLISNRISENVIDIEHHYIPDMAVQGVSECWPIRGQYKVRNRAASYPHDVESFLFYSNTNSSFEFSAWKNTNIWNISHCIVNMFLQRHHLNPMSQYEVRNEVRIRWSHDVKARSGFSFPRYDVRSRRECL